MTWRQRLDGPLRLLTVLSERHIPRLIVITMGAAGIVAGLFFIFLPDHLIHDAWGFLWHAGPPTIWGVLFLIVGGGLTSAGVIQPSRAGFLCFIEALIFFGFAFSTLDHFDANWGTRLICVVALTSGWLCLLGMLATIAPQARKALGNG